MAVQIQRRRDTAENWSLVDPVLAEGEYGLELNTNRTKVGNGVDSWNNLPYISFQPTRQTVSIGPIGDEEDPIAAGSSVQFNIDLGAKALRLYSIETNIPMRVRIYADSVSATADFFRSVTVDPVDNSGCLFEFVTTTELLISKLSPLVDIFSDNENQTEFTFILQNLTDTAEILDATFTYIVQEI
jgi:hypothetical protein